MSIFEKMQLSASSDSLIAVVYPNICFQVNQNGHLTFDRPWVSFIPAEFPLHGSKDIIAPFWTDLDNRETGEVYYNQYTSGSVLQQATQDINEYFPRLNFNTNWVFVATWYEVAYFPNSGTVSPLVLNGETPKNTHISCYEVL